MSALEPFISKKTVKEHHDHHERGYVETLNGFSVVQKLPRNTTLEEVVLRSSGDRVNKGLTFLPPFPQATRLYSCAAQSYNHSFYWHSMKKGGGGDPRGMIASLIRASFSSPGNFKRRFKERAMESFGSGWLWVCLFKGELVLVEGHDAECAFVYQGYHPVLVIDLWEHAWYLDYKHDKSAYIDAFLDNLINWDFANQNLDVVR